MSKIVSIHSFRGGTGKSNVTANLAVTIARAGYRVGIVDTDIQSPGIHVVFHLNEDRVTHCLNDFLWGDCQIEDAAYDVTDAAIGNVADHDERPRVFLVPASIKTSEIGRVLKEGYDVGLLNDGFKRLIQKLNLDFLLIDTHPGVNEETLLSIVISDRLLLVLRPDQQDFQGSSVTLELARRLDVSEVSLVVNKIPPGMDRAQLKTTVESIYNAEVLALLPLNFELVRMASSGLFVNRYPEHPFTRELKLIANSLIKQWRGENCMNSSQNGTDEPLSHLDALLTRMKSAASPLREVLREIYTKYASLDDGVVASYIPELAKANPAWFGISAVSVQGQAIDVGDSEQQFTIQSASKPFMFGLALEDHGREHVLSKIGVQPIGEAFNSITLDQVANRPFNPMINAGAIAAADLVDGKDYPERVTRMIEMFGRYCGRTVYVDNSVFTSERMTGHRNRAIGHLMLNFDMVSNRLDESLELYFQQCSLLVTCRDLAVMGATLANGGVNPITGVRAIDAEYVKDLLSVMHTCGMYDYAGEWAYRIGIPAKSGVGGGIVAVIPGQGGIGTFSPKLDVKGNSVRGIKVFEELAQRFGLHVFEADDKKQSLVSQFSPTKQQASRYGIVRK